MRWVRSALITHTSSRIPRFVARRGPDHQIGAPVRCIRDPYFGLLGSVGALPSEPRVLESGSRARILEVTLKSGEAVIVPRANVELIEQ